MLLKIPGINRKIFFIFSALVLTFLLFSPVLAAASALAATGDYIPLVKIPGVNTADFLQYLKGMYNFLISIVGILAMASLVYGGFRYLTSVGNPAAAEDAKDIINSAIVGLVLALGSWLILNEINPDVLAIKKPGQIGALPGKYVYKEINRACVADPNLEGVLIPNSQDKKCKCVDEKEVTFTPGHYVVSTSIAPCATGVPTSINALTIKFNGAMDSSSISNSTINFYYPAAPQGPVTRALTSPDTVTLSWTGALAENTPKEVVVTTGVKSATGVPVSSDYHLRFTTKSDFGGSTPCVPPPTGTLCNRVCSDPANYHCLKASLRVGKTKDDRTYSSITAKVGETLYFDADTYVIHNKPIVSYEMDYKNDFYSAFSTDKACDVAGAIRSCHTGLTWAGMTPCDGISQNSYKYTATGVYQAWMRVYDEDCNPSESTIDITIENY